MKARVIKTNKVIKVYPTDTLALGGECCTVRLYKDYDGRKYWSNELERVPDDMPLSEPEEEVTIEGRAERTIDGKLRLFVDYINYVYLPADCKIEGEVTITIKPKKK